MAQRNLKNLLSLLIVIFLLESPRLHVETRSLEKLENHDQTETFSDELTTQASISSVKNISTTAETIREATTAYADFNNSPETLR